LDEVLTFSNRARLAFMDLHYRVQILRAVIVAGVDPLSESTKKSIMTLLDEWEQTVEDLR